jgi:hypothetical protein
LLLPYAWIIAGAAAAVAAVAAVIVVAAPTVSRRRQRRHCEFPVVDLTEKALRSCPFACMT